MKKYSFILILLIVVLLFTSCAGGGGSILNPTTAPTAEPTAEPIKLITANSEIEQQVLPFWLQNTMYEETICMIKQDDGSIYGNTLFTPTKIISIKDYKLKTEYVEGVDYKWDRKTNKIEWLEGSSIKYFTKNALAGLDENGNPFKTFDGTFDDNGCSRIGNALYSVSEFVYEKQISITYEYEPGSYNGTKSTYQGECFTKLLTKLQNGEDVQMVLFGDSIFEGCDSSQLRQRDPRQPSFGELIKNYFKASYSSKVKLRNLSTGGKDSAYGLTDVKRFVKLNACDLVLIGWGTNDSCSGAETLSNITSIIEKIRESFPDACILVCSTIHPNDASGFNVNHADIAKELQKVTELGCAYVDMYSVHTDILETKAYIDTSGNNVNHPNDWLIRLYAQNILNAIIDFSNYESTITEE